VTEAALTSCEVGMLSKNAGAETTTFLLVHCHLLYIFWNMYCTLPSIQHKTGSEALASRTLVTLAPIPPYNAAHHGLKSLRSDNGSRRRTPPPAMRKQRSKTFDLGSVRPNLVPSAFSPILPILSFQLLSHHTNPSPVPGACPQRTLVWINVHEY